MQLNCTVCTVQPLGPGHYEEEKENTRKQQKHETYSRLVACLLANCCGLEGIVGIEARAGPKDAGINPE